MKTLQRPAHIKASLAAVLITSAMLAGGSASKPIFEMALALLSLGILLVCIWTTSQSCTQSAATLIVIGASLGGAIVQLLPLPIAIWEGLPQGQLARSLSQDVQLSVGWQTFSISPDATIYSMTAMMPSLVILWLISDLRRKQVTLVVNVVVISAAAVALIGIAQATQAWTTSFFETQHPNVAIGLFASRNHFADLMIIGVSVLFALRKSWSARFGGLVSEVTFHAVLALFAGATVASSSRAGLIVFCIISPTGYALSMKSGLRLRTSGILLVSFGLVAFLCRYLPKTGALKTTLARFEATEDARWEIWQNSISVLRHYWPWGSGLGTFRLAYEQSEPLSSVTPSYVNAAHNEYLQLMIEGGFVGALSATIIVVVVVRQAWENRTDPFVPFALLGLFAILAHSLVDYPFRVIGINVLAALLCAVIVRHREPKCVI